jgi:hypothetical protein
LGGAAVEDRYSYLIEAHERSHAHTAGNEDLYAMLGQVIDRSHASTLLVGNIGESGNFLYFAVCNFHHGVKITMAEMGSKSGFESSGMR